MLAKLSLVSDSLNVTLVCSETQFKAHKVILDWTSGVLPGPFIHCIMQTNDRKEEVPEDESPLEYKVYKEKPYLNSDKDPFGITLNGKTKEYVVAHEGLKSLIVKGKQYNVAEGTMKMLDVTHKKAMVIAIVEVSSKGGSNKGNAELKVHNPSVNKKKGATIELRKISGFEYDHVDKLKCIITTILDGIIAGENIDQVVKTSKKEPSLRVEGRITSKPTLFTCEICSWQTRFGSALKAHMTRMHSSEQLNVKHHACKVCLFVANYKTTLDNHISNEHCENKKRSKSTIKCDVPTCGSTFNSENGLKEHENIQHLKNHSFSDETSTPSSSPPRKKVDKEEDMDVELMDIEIEAGSIVHKMLETRIKQLDLMVVDLQKQKIKDNILKQRLEEENAKMKSMLKKKNEVKDDMNSCIRPMRLNHLSSVRPEHLSKLRGYKLLFKAEPN